MSPLPSIPEITGCIADATEITQVELTLIETIIYGFFAPLGIICALFIITTWIAILGVSIYDTIHDWRRGSWVESEMSPRTKSTNTYFIPDDDEASSPLLDAKKWLENKLEEEVFFRRNGLPNYGTIRQMSRDEIDDIRGSISVSKEMMWVSSGDDQVKRPESSMK
ncbi:hypothetical protein EAE96_011462 [Botrytis aclada]|nr:hypothetical protein EAE96_011462 [Botrytis aclada]